MSQVKCCCRIMGMINNKMLVMHCIIFVLLYDSCAVSDFTFYQDKQVTTDFVKFYEISAPKLCKEHCSDLSGCNSIVFIRKTLQCFLYNGNCETNIIESRNGTTYGCFSNKTNKCGNSNDVTTFFALSRSGHRCVPTECLTTYPPVRNSYVTRKQFDPPKASLQCSLEYTYNGTSNEVVCVPGKAWITFNSRCYLNGIEETDQSEYGDHFGEPFVSNWTTIESQTDSSIKYIAHDCGTFPVRVEVQVRSKSGDNQREFLFNGASSALTDDDEPKSHGGVLYKYDAFQVELYAPRMLNDYAEGFAIYTGESAWHGPFNRKEHAADVRIKTWCPSQIKTPTFESIWFPINHSDTSSFYEINHNLREDPKLVSVQVRLGESDQIVGALGSSSVVDRPSINYGGLIYGTSNLSVRIWRSESEYLWSNSDGWGGSERYFYDGYVKFRLWTEQDLSAAYKQVPIGRYDIVNSTALPHIMDLDKDIIYVSTKVADGDSAGFSFPADTSVQESSVANSFGSVVYAFSETQLAIWQPILNGSIGGQLVYIDSPWGGGAHSQHSANGTLQITVVKAGVTGSE